MEEEFSERFDLENGEGWERFNGNSCYMFMNTISNWSEIYGASVSDKMKMHQRAKNVEDFMKEVWPTDVPILTMIKHDNAGKIDSH